MRTEVFLLLLFFGMIGLASAQIKADAEYLIRYDVKIQTDPTNPDNISRETHRLYTNTHQSYFVNEWKIILDSVISVKLQSIRSGGEVIITPQEISRSGNVFETQVYKDISKSKVLVSYGLAGMDVQYEETDLPLAWEITSEAKEMDGGIVYKANLDFAGRSYEAWFNPEVPIPDGPYIFHGLPGLIFEIYDKEKNYVFELASMTKLKNTYSIDSDDGLDKNMTKEEVKNLYLKVKEQDFKESKKFSPHNPTSAKERRQRALERVQKKENHIEFW